MKPPRFDYYAPASLEEALELLARYGDDAKPLAGGQSLIPVLNFRLARPAVLVDLNRIPSLAGIEPSAEGMRIGAMTRQRQVERSALVAERAPLVFETMPYIAHPQIRNRGTIGGSLAHADPAAELPAVMRALGARFLLCARAGERWIDAEDYFTGTFSTALATGELLAEVELRPLAPGSGYAFEEVARRHGDFALLGVAVTTELDSSGVCTRTNIVFVNPTSGSERAVGAERSLAGRRPGEAEIREAAAIAATDLAAGGDVQASPEYRRQLARVLTVRALTRALTRAVGRAVPR